LHERVGILNGVAIRVFFCEQLRCVFRQLSMFTAVLHLHDYFTLKYGEQIN